MKYKYPSAFSVVKYKKKTDENVIITVWNSRDGIIPLVLSMKGDEYTQIISEYKPMPKYEPKKGEFKFTDMDWYTRTQISKMKVKAAVEKLSDDNKSCKAGEERKYTSKNRRKMKNLFFAELKGSPVLMGS